MSAETELLKFINATPALLSLLYDMDLMPEQCNDNIQRAKMFNVAAHFRSALEAGRLEGRAQLAREQREAQDRIQRIREDEGVEM